MISYRFLLTKTRQVIEMKGNNLEYVGSLARMQCKACRPRRFPADSFPFGLFKKQLDNKLSNAFWGKMCPFQFWPVLTTRDTNLSPTANLWQFNVNKTAAKSGFFVSSDDQIYCTNQVCPLFILQAGFIHVNLNSKLLCHRSQDSLPETSWRFSEYGNHWRPNFACRQR